MEKKNKVVARSKHIEVSLCLFSDEINLMIYACAHCLCAYIFRDLFHSAAQTRFRLGSFFVLLLRLCIRLFISLFFRFVITHLHLATLCTKVYETVDCLSCDRLDHLISLILCAKSRQCCN